MADGDHPGGQAYNIQMKAEMKARMEQRKRRHSCGEVVADLHGGGNVLDGEPHPPPVLGHAAQELEPPPVKTNKEKDLDRIARLVGYTQMR